MRVSEWFYSIQGEGVSAGVPSLFLRFSNCNFMCGGFGGSLVGKENEGSPVTWWCDTEPVWKAGKKYTAEELFTEIFTEYPFLSDLLAHRRAHIILTGGEPTLPTNMKSIMEVQAYFEKRGYRPYYEIETNGSILIDFARVVDQINASPKLANSGMNASMRIQPEVIAAIAEHPNGWFKFVVNTEADIAEIENVWVQDHRVPEDRIILMPGVDKLVDLQRTSQFAFEAAIARGWKATSRLQIVGWDQTTGV